MDHQVFDDLSRALAASGSRRVAIGALAGLLGLSVAAAQDAAGKSKQKRRRQRRQKRKRKERRDTRGLWRNIKVTVGNPLTNPGASEIELGYSFPRDPVKGECCQGAAAYSLSPGQSESWASEESNAYVWVENRHFIRFDNPGILLPFLSWSIDGVTVAYDPTCCKPRGQVLESRFGMEEGETKVLNFNGRLISVQRLPDEDDYKAFFVML